MEGEPKSFWGKVRLEDRRVAGWHPLEHHCADVAACCEALLERTLLASRMARLAERSRSWFPEAFAPDGEPLPVEASFQHAFSGLVTLADWIASDTRFFPYSDDAETDRIAFAREAARKALDGFGIDAAAARARGNRLRSLMG